MLWIYDAIGHNFGIAIILFTILIRLVTWPLNASQLKSTKVMQDLQEVPFKQIFLDLQKTIQDIDKRVMLRNMATFFPLTGAESLGVPTLNADIDDPDWTTELKIGDEDTTLAFGKRRLTPHPVAKWIKVSKDLLCSAAISVEGVVRDRLAYKFAAVEETAFMTGSGAGQPLGLFTASTAGITTSQDVSTGNSNTTTIAT